MVLVFTSQILLGRLIDLSILDRRLFPLRREGVGVHDVLIFL
jgi:hypothetical protein